MPTEFPAKPPTLPLKGRERSDLTFPLRGRSRVSGDMSPAAERQAESAGSEDGMRVGCGNDGGFVVFVTQLVNINGAGDHYFVWRNRSPFGTI